LIFTLGFWASNFLASAAQTFFVGRVVEMFHHSIVVVPDDPPSESPPQPLSAVIPRPAAAEAARKPRRDSAGSPIMHSLYSKLSELCRKAAPNLETTVGR